MRNAIKSKVQTKFKQSHIRTYSITLNFLGQSKLFGVLNIKHYLQSVSGPQEEMELNPKATLGLECPPCPLLWYSNHFQIKSRPLNEKGRIPVNCWDQNILEKTYL